MMVLAPYQHHWPGRGWPGFALPYSYFAQALVNGAGMPVTRVVSIRDAGELAALLTANREFLAPWEPARDDSHFTAGRQREIIARELENYDRDAMIPLVIMDEKDRLAGRINVNGITRGASQSASIGYWVSQDRNGRGLASAAVADVVAFAFRQLDLHRLQAETLLHNAASQRVLTRNGFRPFGIAPSYLKIAGRWQDHILFHLLNE
jgi:ribosomal-protein-alanine N-acetyltransferase